MSNNNNSPNDFPQSQTTSWGRDRLPHPEPANSFSIWNILKKCFGRELYKIAMPVEFNEPLSFLQRLAEIFQYSELLDRGATNEDPVKRMQFVAAFAVAGWSSNLDRLKKPFNPLLAETYELDRSHTPNGFRVICEQVSHHPPISAFYGESSCGRYVVEGCVHPKLKFWGRSVEIKPEGSIRVRFPERDNEEYVWSYVDCCVHNIILGSLYFEQYGDQVITCNNTELQCRINYKAANGPNDIQLHSILGYIINKSGQKVSKISGRWCQEVYAYSMAGEAGEPLWQAKPRPPHSAQFYNFTEMAMALNEFPPTNGHDPDHEDHGRGNSHAEDDDGGDNRGQSRTDHPQQPQTQQPQTQQPQQQQQHRLHVADCDVKNGGGAGRTSTNTPTAPNRGRRSNVKAKPARRLPPTDSRFRPDIRRLEEGDLDGAAAEKQRLEEKQREARKRRGKSAEWKPLWFEKVTETHWRYLGGYWDRPANMRLPDIF